MCDSRRPLNGADSEPVDPRDTSCDYCGQTHGAMVSRLVEGVDVVQMTASDRRAER